ncbi:MAG: tetratricopeptide repeat protein [Deltaproteobacteria bacterium]|nr:tetratricopeptide repeat protein [Deltaproteobacteria bacterium]
MEVKISKKRLGAILALALALALPLGLLLFHHLVSAPEAEREAEFQSLLEKLSPFIRAEENSAPAPSPALLEGSPRSERAETLKEAAKAFFAADYGTSRRLLSSLERSLPREAGLLPLLGAVHLREGNFSLARDYFLKAREAPERDPESGSWVDAGLALSYFSLMDLEKALPPARKAYDYRLRVRGENDPGTLSAANVLSGVLIGLKEYPEAQDVLEKAIAAAFEKGADPETPLVRDSLSLLSLSYQLSESDKDVYALLAGNGEGDSLKGAAEEESLTSESPPATPPGRDPLEAPSAEADPAEGALGESSSSASAPGEGADREGSISADPEGAPPMEGGAPEKADTVADYNFPLALSLYNDLSRVDPRSPLRPRLVESMIRRLSPGEPLCRDPGEAAFRGSLWFLCVDLAESMNDSYVDPLSLSFAENLLSWDEAKGERRSYLVREAAALEKAARGDYSASAKHLEEALNTLSSGEKLTDKEKSFLILRSITLADLLKKGGVPAIETEIGLSAAVTRVERLVSEKERAGSMELPFLYWYLARTQRENGRHSDSRANFKKASRRVSGLLKLHPERKAELERLLGLIKEDEGYRPGKSAKDPPGFPNSPRIFYPAHLEAGKKNRDRVSAPQAMRVEMEVLKFLGKPEDFEPMIRAALLRSEKSTQDELLYRSLNLKYLEETGNVRGLLAELEDLYQNPPPGDEGSLSQFRSSVKVYEGRALAAQGDREGAKAAYEKALEHLEGIPGTEEKRSELLGEMERL